MKEDKKYWLNESGYREWKSKDGNTRARRMYHWVDRVIFLEGNRYIGDVFYSLFVDEDNWIPVTIAENKEEIRLLTELDKLNKFLFEMAGADLGIRRKIIAVENHLIALKLQVALNQSNPMEAL